MAFTITLCATTFLLGLVCGLVMNYIVETRPLLRDYRALISTLTGMKKQGFVPQFEIQQRKPLNPAEDVVEY